MKRTERKEPAFREIAMVNIQQFILKSCRRIIEVTNRGGINAESYPSDFCETKSDQESEPAISNVRLLWGHTCPGPGHRAGAGIQTTVRDDE
jgi:hypothetical protein